VTTSDVERLYQALAEITAEVRGYRADLNGRLKALELAEARREGMGAGRGGVGRFVLAVAAVAAAVGSVCGAIVAIL
jgi:hypothetical protein